MPCIATNISVAPGCISNSTVVSWSGPKGAVQYYVSASSSQNNATCLSSELHCTLTSLMCGTTYSVDVKAVNGDCSSEPSLALTFSSGMRWGALHTCTNTCKECKHTHTHTHTLLVSLGCDNKNIVINFLTILLSLPSPVCTI